MGVCTIYGFAMGMCTIYGCVYHIWVCYGCVVCGWVGQLLLQLQVVDSTILVLTAAFDRAAVDNSNVSAEAPANARGGKELAWDGRLMG